MKGHRMTVRRIQGVLATLVAAWMVFAACCYAAPASHSCCQKQSPTHQEQDGFHACCQPSALANVSLLTPSVKPVIEDKDTALPQTASPADAFIALAAPKNTSILAQAYVKNQQKRYLELQSLLN